MSYSHGPAQDLAGTRRHPSIVTTDHTSPPFSASRPPVPIAKDFSTDQAIDHEAQFRDSRLSHSPGPAQTSLPLPSSSPSPKATRRKSYSFLPGRKSSEAQDQSTIVASPVSSNNSPLLGTSTEQSQDRKGSLPSDDSAPSLVFKTTGWKNGLRYKMEELWQAVFHSDRDKIERCLSAGLSVDYCHFGNYKGNLPGIWNLVDISIMADRVENLKTLLRYKPDLTGEVKARYIGDQRRKHGENWYQRVAPQLPLDDFMVYFASKAGKHAEKWMPPLHLAAWFGRVSIVKILLEQEMCDPNILDHKARTTLHQAVTNGDLEVADLLLDRGAQIDWGDHLDVTPLQVAVLRGNLSMVKKLVERGSLLNRFDSFGETALYEAAARDKPEICAYLADAGADLESKNHTGISAFFKAASTFNTKLMDVLSDRGADIDSRDSNGCSPLLRAFMARNNKLASALLAYGADIDASDKDGWTALDVAMIHLEDSLMGILLLNGANLSLSDAQGNLVIHRAAARGSTSLMRHLLAVKFPDVHNKFGETPLHLAAANGHLTIIRLLLRKHANVDLIDDFGYKPLHRAMLSGSFAIVRELCHHGADVNPEAVSRLLRYNTRDGKKENTEHIHRFLIERYPDLQSSITATGAAVNDQVLVPTTLDRRMEAEMLRPKQGKEKSQDPFEACIPKDPISQVINNILVNQGQESSAAADVAGSIAGNVVSGVISGLL